MNVPGSSGLAIDGSSLGALRGAASKDPKAAIKETAKQFEALFMQELMKSMRQATQSSGLLDNAGTQLGTDMLDQQYSAKMTGMPGGLADAIARQLEKQMSPTTATPAKPQAAFAPAGAAGAASGGAIGSVAQRQAEFVAANTEAAKAAEAQTGIPATFMVAQAAHESGWGRRDIKNADGSSSNNLFGIKAGANWTGKVAEVSTTEYVDGVARKTTAKFRAYDSTAESFADYANLMKSSPRYAQTLAKATTAEGFAKGLQKAGYATDPAYADKLTRMINTTLRVQRSMV